MIEVEIKKPFGQFSLKYVLVNKISEEAKMIAPTSIKIKNVELNECKMLIDKHDILTENKAVKYKTPKYLNPPNLNFSLSSISTIAIAIIIAATKGTMTWTIFPGT